MSKSAHRSSDRARPCGAPKKTATINVLCVDIPKPPWMATLSAKALLPSLRYDND